MRGTHTLGKTGLPQRTSHFPRFNMHWFGVRHSSSVPCLFARFGSTASTTASLSVYSLPPTTWPSERAECLGSAQEGWAPGARDTRAPTVVRGKEALTLRNHFHRDSTKVIYARISSPQALHKEKIYARISSKHCRKKH